MEIIDILKIVVEAGKEFYSQFGYYPPIIYRGCQIGNAEMGLV
jgi:hypothetical protein